MGDLVINSKDIGPSNPSTVIKSHREQITIDGKTYDLTLVVMKRSFLLVIEAAKCLRPGPSPLVHEDASDYNMSEESLVQSFMSKDPPLKGLSLAIGEASTCLIPSENSIVSSSLAIRLSKKLNQNRPVYVASDVQPPSDTYDLSDFMSKFYLKTFQFVGAHYQAYQY